MASIFVLTEDDTHYAYERTADVLTGAGHTVTATEATTTSGLDTDWGAGHDLIVTVRSANDLAAHAEWLRDQWNTGVPLLLGGDLGGALNGDTTSVLEQLGFIETPLVNSDSSTYAADELLVSTAGEAHPITSGYSGTVAVLYGRNYSLVDRGTSAGTVLGDRNGTLPGAYMAAIEAGDSLLAATYSLGAAPGRAVWIGWLYAGQDDYTDDGATIVENAVNWVTTVSVPSASAALGVTSTGSLAVSLTVPAGADLGITSTGSLAVTLTVPASAALGITSSGSLTATVETAGQTAADLGITSTGSLAVSVTAHASAALGITSIGTLTIAGAGGPSADLGITSTGALTVTVTAGHYTRADLGLGSTGALTVTVTAQAAATLGIRSTGTLSVTRQWLHHHETGRAVTQLRVVDVDGTGLGVLDRARIAGAPTSQGLGIGDYGHLTFTLPAGDAYAGSLRRFRHRIQLWRGGHIEETYVITAARDIDDTGTLHYTCRTVPWLLGHRLIGPAVRPNLLSNGGFEQGLTGWRAGYRKGSIPAQRPEHAITRDPAVVVTGDQALRIAGSTDVQVTKTVFDTDVTFATGSAVLTGEGRAAVKAFVRDEVLGQELEDNEEAAPIEISVDGHTDNVPYTSHPGGNQWLSEQRAEAVADEIRPMLPEGSTVTTTGHADRLPVASNATNEGRAQNRRVEVDYPYTVTARGHRQFVRQTIEYTNPSTEMERTLTLVAFAHLEDYQWPSADGYAVWLGRPATDPDTGDSLYEVAGDREGMDGETPLDRLLSFTAEVTVPAGWSGDIDANLVPPGGSMVFDQVLLQADDALECWGTDQADIVAQLVAHAQDAAFDKDDLHLAAITPASGVKRDRVWFWHDRMRVSEALAEVESLSRGPEIGAVSLPDRVEIRTWTRRGRDTGIVLVTREHGAHAPVLYSEDAASTVIVQASGYGSARLEEARTGGDLGIVMESVYSAEPETTPGDLGEQADRQHALVSADRPGVEWIDVPCQTMRPGYTTSDWLMDHLQVGDTFYLDHHSTLGNPSGRVRVVRRRRDVAADIVGLQVAPEPQEA